MTHLRELDLRRLLAGEAVVNAEHAAACPECTATLVRLQEEQRAFEAQVPFERFAAGVELKVRPRSRRWLGVAAAMAAGLLTVVGVQFQKEGTGNRIKGGASVEFVIAGAAGQRPAAAVETLAAGERVRIGVSGARHALVVSIDERGEVSPVYDEIIGDAHAWLPESLEFTGAGRELVLVVLSDERQSTSTVSQALRRRFDDVKGDLNQLGSIDVPGVQLHRTFIKP